MRVPARLFEDARQHARDGKHSWSHVEPEAIEPQFGSLTPEPLVVLE